MTDYDDPSFRDVVDELILLAFDNLCGSEDFFIELADEALAPYGWNWFAVNEEINRRYLEDRPA
jgi:hypothetical protein